MSTPKIPTKAEWIRALQSGKYPQARKSLAILDNGEMRYCCIGVAAQLAGCQWQDRPVDLVDYQDCTIEIEPGQFKTINYSAFPLETIQKILGLPDLDTTFAACRYLAELNDEDYSFDEIANHIENDKYLDALITFRFEPHGSSTRISPSGGYKSIRQILEEHQKSLALDIP